MIAHNTDIMCPTYIYNYASLLIQILSSYNYNCIPCLHNFVISKYTLRNIFSKLHLVLYIRFQICFKSRHSLILL